MSKSLNRECHACCVCNQYRFDCTHFKIDYHFSIPEKDRPPKTLTEVDRVYSGIRSICPECLAGVTKLGMG